VLRGRPVVLDTATLWIDGQVVKLHGVGRGWGRFVAAMRGYIGSQSVVCRHVRARAYRCEVGGYDLAEVVVHNGGARAGPQAPPALVRAERQARRAGRGLWGR
jgi:endonuclease YncB( thermonuclease family)